MKSKITSRLLYLLLSLIVISISAKMIWFPIWGKVLDESTGKPIVGAVVVALWQGVGAYTTTICFHVKSTVSDAKGRYSFPLWINASGSAFLNGQNVIVMAYKDGYRWSDTHEKETEYLEPFTGTREERLEYLKRVSEATSCPSAGKSGKSRILLKRRVFEEAERIAITEEEKDIADTLFFGLYSLIYDSDTARRMLSERIGARRAGKRGVEVIVQPVYPGHRDREERAESK